MQKIVIAGLVLLVLALSTAVVRSQGREERLEEKLAATEKARPSRPVADPTPVLEESKSAPRAPEPEVARVPASKHAVMPQAPAAVPAESAQVRVNRVSCNDSARVTSARALSQHANE